MSLCSYNLHTYLTAVDFNWPQLPTTPLNFSPLCKKQNPSLKLESRREWKSLRRQTWCNSRSAGSERCAHGHHGKSWSCGVPINLSAIPELHHGLLMTHSTVPKSLQKEGQTPHYFIKFLLFSFLSVWYLLPEKWAALARCTHRRVFIPVREQQRPPGKGGICRQRMSALPIFLNIRDKDMNRSEHPSSSECSDWDYALARLVGMN